MDLSVVNLVDGDGNGDGFAYRDNGRWRRGRREGSAKLSLEDLRGWSWFAYDLGAGA